MGFPLGQTSGVDIKGGVGIIGIECSNKEHKLGPERSLYQVGTSTPNYLDTPHITLARITTTTTTTKDYIRNMVSQTSENIEYNHMDITMMTITINETNNQDTVNRSSLMETFSLKQGIHIFGQKGFRSTYGLII